MSVSNLLTKLCGLHLHTYHDIANRLSREIQYTAQQLNLLVSELVLNAEGDESFEFRFSVGQAFVVCTKGIIEYLQLQIASASSISLADILPHDVIDSANV